MFDRGRSIDSVGEFLRCHGETLRGLPGRTISQVWTAWDSSSNEWFSDEAVIVDLEAARLEIVCWKLSDIMLSTNEIDLAAPPRWVADWGPDFELSWRPAALAELEPCIGQPILDVRVLEYHFSTTVVSDPQNPSNVGRQNSAWLLHGLELELRSGVLAIFNDLDKNGITATPPSGPDFRRVHLQ